jgi:hypothetical protein
MPQRGRSKSFQVPVVPAGFDQQIHVNGDNSLNFSKSG